MQLLNHTTNNKSLTIIFIGSGHYEPVVISIKEGEKEAIVPISVSVFTDYVDHLIVSNEQFVIKDNSRLLGSEMELFWNKLGMRINLADFDNKLFYMIAKDEARELFMQAKRRLDDHYDW